MLYAGEVRLRARIRPGCAGAGSVFRSRVDSAR